MSVLVIRCGMFFVLLFYGCHYVQVKKNELIESAVYIIAKSLTVLFLCQYGIKSRYQGPHHPLKQYHVQPVTLVVSFWRRECVNRALMVFIVPLWRNSSAMKLSISALVEGNRLAHSWASAPWNSIVLPQGEIARNVIIVLCCGIQQMQENGSQFRKCFTTTGSLRGFSIVLLL